MKPLILITPSIIENESALKAPRAYTSAVETAGGIAVIPDFADINSISRLLEITDGVLLSGGGDIEPSIFGEAPIKEIGEITPMRDAFEIELVKRASVANKPILGICRGAQILNVAFGGSVYQDIYSQIKTPVMKHSQEMPGRYGSHFVKLEEGSIIKRIAKSDEIRVNSFHHQAVCVLGRGVKKTAIAQDGVIEAIEHMGKEFCIGVQWHPERMTADSQLQLEIFKEFIRAAQNNIQRKD